jgi:hypothetical protein
MALDLSRSAFDPRTPKHWSGVRTQQGRLITDDDWNEADAIDKEDLRRTRVQVIGSSGSADDGFKLANPRIAGNHVDFDLTPGTIYVGGLRVTLEAQEAFSLQRDWLQQAASDRVDLAGAERIDMAYLEVWEQPVAAVEDQELLEVALGGPDTSVRQRVMRRVHLVPNVAAEDCGVGWAAVTSQVGTLSAENELVPAATLQVGYLPNTGAATNLCSPSAQDGYLGAENQAIRVEVGSGGNTLLWGYDNASPLYRVQVTHNTSGAQVIRFLTHPRDEAHWPLAGQTVELLPWSAVLPNGQKVAESSGGFLAKVARPYDPNAQDIAVTPVVPGAFGTTWQSRTDAPALSTVADSFFYLRVWNRGSDTTSPEQIPIPSSTKTVELAGTGLKVTFAGGTPRPGDFWIIAARPDSPANVVPWQLESGRGAEGVRRFFAPLGLIHWRPSGPQEVFDCRDTFVPLTRQRGCCLMLSPGQAWQHVLASVADDDDLCVCFQPGDYVTHRTFIFTNKNVRIHGDGLGSRIHGVGVESVFTFNGCESVEVNDIAVDVDTSLPGGARPHLSGAITTFNCAHVEITGVRARSASGPVTSSSAIAVNAQLPAAAAARATAVISRCDVVPGANQVGLSVIGYGRTTISDNTVSVDPVENRELPAAWLQDKRFLREFRRALIYKFALWDKNDPGSPAGAADVMFGDLRVAIYTDHALEQAWQDVVQWRKLPLRRKDHRAVADFLNALAESLIRGNGTVGPHSSAAFKTFLNGVIGLRTADGLRGIAARGIVVAGGLADEVRIVGNTVRNAVQGIHVGVSAQRVRNPGTGVSDTAGRVVISDNTVHVVLMPESAVERHGVFVGNCRSLIIEDNYITCERPGTASRLSIEGIRVYGFLGPMAYVTRNHISGFHTGVRMAALNNRADGAGSMWRVVDNIAREAIKTVDVSLKFGAATHVTSTGNMP